MSALLAALQRLEGLNTTGTRGEAPQFASTTPLETTLPVFPTPIRSDGWDEVTLPAELLPTEDVIHPDAYSAAAPDVTTEDGAAALAHILHAPALAAVVGIGLEGELVPLLREFGESLSCRTTSDVVLLGPGMLDDVAALSAQWKVLSPHVGYGLVHTSAERAVARLDALQQTAGVIAVVELGRTRVEAVEAFRTRLAERKIPLLGTLAIRDDVA